jgi:STE24 endopeptidase
MMRLGWSARWSGWTGRVTRRAGLRAGLYAIPYALAGFVLVLPWTIYTGFVREHQYGLSNQSFGAWAGDQGLQLIIGMIVTALLLMGLFAVIRRSPKRWWLWGTGVMTLFLVIGVAVAPVFITPLFNTYKPMPHGPLRDQILAMARAHDVPADNVYVFDASKQTKRISANVSGLGPTIRISLNDNLLNRTSPAEVKAVMGHELGHYVLNHVGRLIVLLSAMLLFVFFMLWWLTPRLLARYGDLWGVRGVSDPAVTPVFAAIASVLFLLLTPVTNTLIRVNESEADAFGLDAAREPDGFALTAMKLSEYRKIEPSALEEAIFFDHPSGRTRVRMAMEWKARHLNEAR